MKLNNIAKIALISSIALLFCKNVFIGWFRPDVILLVISALAALISYYRGSLDINFKKHGRIFLPLLLIMASILFGSIISIIKFDSIPLQHVLIEWRILLGCILAFVLIIILGEEDKKFLTIATYSFLPSLILVITPYFPKYFLSYVLEGSNRFGGLIGSSNFYPTLMILPTILIFYLITENVPNKRWLTKFILGLILSISIGLIIWSGSRSGWLGLSTSFIVYIYLSIRNSQNKIWKAISLLSILAITSLASIVILPDNAKYDITRRVNFIVSQPPPVTSSSKEKVYTNISIIDKVSHSQDRLSIWHNSLPFVYYSPLGYGLDYNEIINIKSESGEHSGAHSLPLELLLIGGIATLFSFSYLALKISSSFFQRQIKGGKTDIEVVLFSSLVGVFVCVLFLGALLIRWLWIIMAIILSWQNNRTSKEQKTSNNTT